MNMSYCMHENTMTALQQVITAMDEGCEELGNMAEYIKSLSRSERRHFMELVDACRDFVNTVDEVEDQEGVIF